MFAQNPDQMEQLSADCVKKMCFQMMKMDGRGIYWWINAQVMRDKRLEII